MVTILKPHRPAAADGIDIATEDLPGTPESPGASEGSGEQPEPDTGIELSKDERAGTASAPGEGPNPTA